MKALHLPTVKSPLDYFGEDEKEPSEEKEVLSYREAATFLGINLNTLYVWVARKQVPHIRYTARMVVFERSALKRWRDKGRVAGK